MTLIWLLYELVTLSSGSKATSTSDHCLAWWGYSWVYLRVEWRKPLMGSKVAVCLDKGSIKQYKKCIYTVRRTICRPQPNHGPWFWLAFNSCQNYFPLKYYCRTKGLWSSLDRHRLSWRRRRRSQRWEYWGLLLWRQLRSKVGGLCVSSKHGYWCQWFKESNNGVRERVLVSSIGV